MSTLNVDARTLQRQLDASDLETLMGEYGAPVAHIMLPKQKALKRIAQEVFQQSPILFQSQPKRIDTTLALNAKTGDLYAVSIEHTEDALTLIDICNGFSTINGSGLKLPIVAMVGYDGMRSVSMRRAEKGENSPFEIHTTLQTTKGGLVFAAKSKDTLIALKEQERIAVAKTYQPLYERFLKEALGHDHNIKVVGFKGGGEHKPIIMSNVDVVGELVDSGGSLIEAGYTHVIPVHESPVVLATHSDLFNRVDEITADKIHHLAGHLQDASRKAFPNEPAFDPKEATLSRQATNVGAAGDHLVMDIETYLDQKGKAGRRKDHSEERTPFAGIEPAILTME